MEVADNVAAVDLCVHEVLDHLQPTFAIEGGVRWRWIDETARERGAAIQAPLRELAACG